MDALLSQQQFAGGADMLGDEFIAHHSAAERRATGSVYTPMTLVASMVQLAKRSTNPSVIVDCGCGSGRFAIACAQAFPNAKVFAVDNSIDACAMCRRNVGSLGLGERITIVNEDFMSFEPWRGPGPTLWIGNPPYVRHHDIDQAHKQWFRSTSEELGCPASLLSGLHAYFLARIAQLWQDGDAGVLITSAEWLDINYGKFIRNLLTERLDLGSLELFDRRQRTFESAESTAVVFACGSGFASPDERVNARVHGEAWHPISLETLRSQPRWSSLVLNAPQPQPSERPLVPLGSLAAVHRGVVTGNNAFWVRDADDLVDVPKEFQVPVVSHAREIMGECVAQSNPSSLRRLVALPQDLDALSPHEANAARSIIARAEEQGVQRGYVASHRKPWWSVVPPKPPAIMMTYMARQSPVFVVNKARLPMLNVVHGIYPKQPMSTKAITRLADYLNKQTAISQGRMYSGGLVKFEPKEAEGILVPPLSVLEE